MRDTDEQLVAAYIAGDEAAFVSLLDRYLRPLYGFVFQMTREKEMTEDIVQETFIKAWKHLDRFDREKSFKAWMFTIAKNTAFDFLKKKKTVPFSWFRSEEGVSALDNIPASGIDPAEILDREVEVRELEERLSALPPMYQILLRLHYQEGFSLHEIAEILNESYNTVKSRHQRALEKLRQAFVSSASGKESFSYHL